MSQTQFVQYGGRGFWAYDVSLAIVVKHLVDAADREMTVGEADWLRAAVSWWRVVASVGDYNFEVDENWSEDQVRTFLRLVDAATAEIGCRPAIPAEEARSWSLLEGEHLETRGEAPIPTAPILALGRAIISLVDGSLPPPPSGTFWLFGTANSPDVIRRRDARQ